MAPFRSLNDCRFNSPRSWSLDRFAHFAPTNLRCAETNHNNFEPSLFHLTVVFYHHSLHMCFVSSSFIYGNGSRKRCPSSCLSAEADKTTECAMCNKWTGEFLFLFGFLRAPLVLKNWLGRFACSAENKSKWHVFRFSCIATRPARRGLCQGLREALVV